LISHKAAAKYLVCARGLARSGRRQSGPSKPQRGRPAVRVGARRRRRPRSVDSDPTGWAIEPRKSRFPISRGRQGDMMCNARSPSARWGRPSRRSARCCRNRSRPRSLTPALRAPMISPAFWALRRRPRSRSFCSSAAGCPGSAITFWPQRRSVFSPCSP
jgi:hypothetical protein